MARAKHRRLTTRRKAGRIAAGSLSVLMLAGLTTAGLAYRNLDDNISAIDTTTALGDDRPMAATLTDDTPRRPLNILLVGSDSREGSTIGGQTPGLSDTTIVVHVNAERTAVTGVSIPRDSMVQRPDCLAKDGTTQVPGELSMFNEAFAIGGIGCTQRTVEQLTGIRLDHFAIVNLAGFQDMVDALGGVPICVPTEVNDDIGRIYLPAGAYNATGQQALGYVRERHTMSANGDLGRMKRQQAFLAAMAHKVLSTDTITNPVRLYSFLDAATESLTTDPDLASIRDLASLASELGDLTSANIRFLSIPTQAYPADPNRLEWTPEADQVWDALRTDTTLPALVRDGVTTAAERPPTGAGDAQVRTADENGLCA